MIEQCQPLPLAILGYLTLDFDLQIFDDENNIQRHELTHGLYTHIDTAMKLIQSPTIVGLFNLFLHSQYRQIKKVIYRYLQ